MSRRADQPIFPQEKSLGNVTVSEGGMTLFEHCLGQALTGTAQETPGRMDKTPLQVVERAWIIATTACDFLEHRKRCDDVQETEG